MIHPDWIKVKYSASVKLERGKISKSGHPNPQNHNTATCEIQPLCYLNFETVFISQMFLNITYMFIGMAWSQALSFLDLLVGNYFVMHVLYFAFPQ